MAKHNSDFAKRLAQVSGNATYLSPQIQNEIIFAISDEILDSVCKRVLKSGYFALLADETKDASKTEQISIILRFVDTGSWTIEERFLGFVPAMTCNAESLTKYIIDTISKCGLSINRCVAQAYDGASVMSGSCTGVQTRVQQHAPMAIYIHCMAHRLNLVLVDVCKEVQSAADFFNLLEALYVFMSSGVSHPQFIETQKRMYADRSPIELKRMIDTRWSCRYESIETFLKVFAAVIQTLTEISATHRSPERAALARGYLCQIENLDFVLMLVIMEKILRVTYVLSNALQNPDLDLAAAVALINSVVDTLQDLRANNSTDNWAGLSLKAEQICIDNNIVVEHSFNPAAGLQRQSRRARAPTRLDEYVTMSTTGARRHQTESETDQAISADSPAHVNDSYRTSVFIVLIDCILSEINKRFGGLQNSFFSAVQALLPTSEYFMCSSIIQPLFDHYRTLFPHNSDTELSAELMHVKTVLRNVAPAAKTMVDVARALKPLEAAFPRLSFLLQLALTLPVSTASCERTFSCIEHVKTYLRTTMTSERLNGLALMTIENELTRDDDFGDNVVQKFKAAGNNRRIAL